MGRFVVIVLDGFGVGEMPDVLESRPGDRGSNTCFHIFEKVPGLYLPTLEKLGLVNIAGTLSPAMSHSPLAVFGRAMLAHDGADTFFGHQEIMGTRSWRPYGEPFKNKIGAVEELLKTGGFWVRRYGAGGEELLIADECVTVADNIECDPGQAFNVTASLDDISFSKVLEIGRLVRSVSMVPRVIAFGGRKVHLQNLLDAVEVHGEYIGINAPLSGVYVNDYHCVHLGYGVDPEVQVPTILGRAAIPVFLFGKVADVVQNDFGVSIPLVNTVQVLRETRAKLLDHTHGFFCTNIQETDLCGHRENAEAYAEKLREADSGIATIIDILTSEDILVVMADHGNDPMICHPHHTREIVPLMIYSAREGPVDIGMRTTLSDVAATAAEYFEVRPPENGRSFLSMISHKRV